MAQLSSFLRDVTNRKNEGRATRNEELAAEVSLANATLQEISARKDLDAAWATYNRYLYRPPGFVVDLQEIAGPLPSTSLDALTAHPIQEHDSSFTLNEPVAADLTSSRLAGPPGASRAGRTGQSIRRAGPRHDGHNQAASVVQRFIYRHRAY